MLRKPLALLTAAVAVLSLTSAAYACPFCSAPSLTFAEQVSQSDAVVLVKWKDAKKSDGRLPGNTTYEISEIAKGSKATLKPGKEIVLGQFHPAKKGDQFLLLGTRAVNVEWSRPVEVSSAGYKYISKAPHPKKPTAERLTYYLKYLEFPDEVISNDAYAEFANAPYKDIASLAKDMPRERIRKWIASSDTAPTRLGLYGLLLGLCGKPEDAKLMEKKILEKSNDYRLGIEGVMSGYLLLTGEKGLKVIEDAKLKDEKIAFSETYAAMQAVSFVWDYAPGKIKKDRLRQSMRLLLDRATVADLVIANLARWKDWGIQDRLMKLYNTKEYDNPPVRRAIVRFLLVCSKDAKEGTPPEKLPAHVKTAKKNLQLLRKKDPKTVRDAERFFL
jgi:hypothetical protein